VDVGLDEKEPKVDDKYARRGIGKAPRHYEVDPEWYTQRYSRVVAVPLRRTKHVALDLCTPQGTIERRTVARSHGQEYGYRHARKVNWGDMFGFDAPPSRKEVRTERRWSVKAKIRKEQKRAAAAAAAAETNPREIDV
jgi:ribosomal protein RSM22 (predicted rRNA methylase)